ncbi:AIR synthase related protein [bacterium]|nr:AIR synthase related protein [bacterium]
MLYKNQIFDFAKMKISDFEKIRKENGWGLTFAEFKEAQKRAKKPLTLTEVYILDSLWSDHCSYKNSKHKLKNLVRDNSYVLKSKNSEAGAVRIGKSDYYAVFKIESHNHPTLINPFDGAATGVGGVLRDIFAMGATNVGVGASLRYGPKATPTSKNVLKGAIEGASFYCKGMELPIIALDVYYDESFKHNCLMNVAAVGVVKKDDLIPNVVPQKGVGYNLIYIGKPTAGAAVGGASFASQAFEEGKKIEISFGANPLLEKATFDVFEKVKKTLVSKKLFSQMSLKDMGAAGLTCSTAEQVAPRGYGIEIFTEKVPVPEGAKVHPLALAVGEDQERNMVIASDKATEVILEIFKKDTNFNKYGGKIAVVGKVLAEDRFIIRDKKVVYCDIPLSLIIEAPVYKPKGIKTEKTGKLFSTPKPKSLKQEILNVISSTNVCSKQEIFNEMKLEKPDLLVTKPDETDVPVIVPLRKDKNHKNIGISLVFGGKSIHGRDGTPLEQAYLATIIARLKLATSGLKPTSIADGCNYGNPDVPEHYHHFSAGIDGLNKACRIPIYKEKEPVAVVAGNVSMKNTLKSKGKEKAIDPSMVPVVFGYISDFKKAVTTGLKEADNILVLVGERRHEFKGAEYARLKKQVGKNLPYVTPNKASKLEYGVLEASEKELFLSSAVIENGGMAAALTRMLLLGKNGIGVQLDMEFIGNMREDYGLFSESIGYILEVKNENLTPLKKIYTKHGLKLINIGVTTKEKKFVGTLKNKLLFEISFDELKKNWRQ